MAFTPEQANYYHDQGLMRTTYWAQQNGKSAAENLIYQHQEIYKKFKAQEKAKKRAEVKKQIQQEVLDAIVYTMSQGSEIVADAAANDMINTINAAFGGGSIRSNKTNSFSADLGFILGRALGEGPFKLLDEIFEDEE